MSGCFAGPKETRILERADAYFKAGDYEKAKVEYLNLLRLNNQNVRAFQQLGFIWMEEGEPLRAVPFLAKVRELAPQNTPARAKLALALMAVGQPTEARKAAITTIEQDPSNADAIGVLADTSKTREEIAATEQQLEKFAQKDTAAFHIARASLAAQKGSLGAASDELQQALAVDPKSAKAHLVLGYVFLLRKDPAHARSELKTAADLAPARSLERLKYAEFLASGNSRDEAKAVLQGIIKEAPYYIPAWRDLAKTAVAEEKYDEALTFLENDLSRDPLDPDAQLLQAQIWLAKGNPAKATQTLDRINTDFPNNPLVKYSLARAYLASNNPAQAAAELEQAISIQPDYPDAILALAELNLSSGKAQKVVPAMEDLLKKHPDSLQARSLLANAYQTLGRVDDAAKLLREETKAAPQSADAYVALGLVLRQQKKDDEARQAFEKAAELAPDNVNAIDQLVEMDLAEKRYEAAAQRAEQQLKKQPDAAFSHYLEAKVYMAHGGLRDSAQAEAALRKALELDKNFTPAYQLLVTVYLGENKLKDALAQLNKHVEEENPRDTQSLLISALIYEQMKDYTRARDSYIKVLGFDPNSMLGLNNLAYLYAEHLNDLGKANELAQKARAQYPNSAMVADTLGWTLYKRGDYQKALPLLQQSAGALAQNPEVQYHLGMASYMMNQLAEARSALKKAVDAPADFSGKDEARKRLEFLQNSGGEKGQLSTSELEAKLKQQPNDMVAISSLAESYEKQGDAAKAAANYEQALKLNPKLLSATLKLAQLYAGPLQNPTKAVEFAKKARAIAPNDAQTSAVAGHVALEARNFNWAYGLLQESARQRADDPAVLHDLAMTAYALGKVPEARQTMQRCLNAAPDSAQAEDAKKFLRTTALDQSSPELATAGPEIQKILTTQPDYLPALMAQAAIDLSEKNTQASVNRYQDVLRVYPDFAPAQKQLAVVYSDNPDMLAKAYELAMKARKTLPDDPELARTLAEISFKRNEFVYAAQLFQESNARQPLPAKDLYYLGMAQLQSRQEPEGRKTLERALSAGLEDPLAQEAKKRLAEQQPK